MCNKFILSILKLLTHMKESDMPKAYSFPAFPENTSYRIFPDGLENDDRVFFHGTAECNLAPILENGFIVSNELNSTSFSRDSSLALNYACRNRSELSPNGVVIAVRYGDLDKRFIAQEAFGVHVNSFSEPPEVIGYCVVPASYVFR